MPDQPNSAAAEIAREVNENILALEARLREVIVHALVPDEDQIGLFCECGCMGIVTSTRSEDSRKGGAWLEGHEPPASS